MYHALDFYWVTARVEADRCPTGSDEHEVCCLTTPVGIAREIVCDGENAYFSLSTMPEVLSNGRLRSCLTPPNECGSDALRADDLEEMHAGHTTERVREVYAKALSVAQARLGEPCLTMNTLAAGAAEFEDGARLPETKFR